MDNLDPDEVIESGETRREIRERLSYLEELAKLEPHAYLETIKRRTLLATTDIFGQNFPAMSFFAKTLLTGSPDPETFGKVQMAQGSQLILEEKIEQTGYFFENEMLRFHSGEFYYYFYEEYGLSGLWNDLQVAGLTYAQISRYIENFDVEKAPESLDHYNMTDIPENAKSVWGKVKGWFG